MTGADRETFVRGAAALSAIGAALVTLGHVAERVIAETGEPDRSESDVPTPVRNAATADTESTASAEAPPPKKRKGRKPKPAAESPAADTPPANDTAGPATGGEPVKLVDVQHVARSVYDKCGAAVLMPILRQFNVQSVSDCPVDKLPALLAELALADQTSGGAS